MGTPWGEQAATALTEGPLGPASGQVYEEDGRHGRDTIVVVVSARGGDEPPASVPGHARGAAEAALVIVIPRHAGTRRPRAGPDPAEPGDIPAGPRRG
ncbi:hypothetical protein [Sphaerisporangium sp. TRM90804]|uniref:hypothetical protein n=1 Tax=Sphaerisporangium sp. TRM90804 TaxID=3031113 RepID=UPI00244C33E0|nr:hypothetical protein [Sphaerisporangium sp. TRM90804]MDH2425437.1 hypothetical protein [Sphaerisporangium sp. TRM90804]